METESSRRAAIVVGAAGLFVRYGFRKTSMDDIARSMKLSRQGLYFHFSSKEAVFRAVVEHLVDVTLAATRAALDQPDRALAERLLAAFGAMAASAVEGADPATVQELLASATELVGDVVQRHDEQLLLALAEALGHERRKRGVVSSEALAEHLLAVSYGFKQRGHTGEHYLARMRIAIDIVCRSEGLVDRRSS